MKITLEQILKEMESTGNMSEIARRLGVTDSNINYYKRKYGLNLTGKRGKNFRVGLTDQQIVEIVELRESGMTTQSIADRFSISESTVYSLLRGKKYYLAGGKKPIENTKISELTVAEFRQLMADILRLSLSTDNPA